MSNEEAHDEALLAFTARLADAVSFDEAARETLAMLMKVVGDALGAASHASHDTAHVVRGMVHLRPGGAYQCLVAMENGVLVDPTASNACLPSTTAWRWVSESSRPLTIDMYLGLLELDAQMNESTHGAASAPVMNPRETQRRLVGRGVTHLLAFPLRSVGGPVVGMISLELNWRAAIGRSLLAIEPHGVARKLTRIIAAVAAPFLTGLPPQASEVVEPDVLLPVVGTSMASIVRLLRVFANQDETILIAGPTGSGKSRMARWCHARSPVAGGPFENVDLSTVPEELQLGELFGWKRGAFTGAAKDTAGCLARGEGGTVFIDEIDKLSLKSQAGLLRVMEERRYRPLGDGAPERTAAVRFIVGTNIDLAAAVRSAAFREDLYYRINVLPVRVPGLGERRDEIPGWARFMLHRASQDLAREGSACFTAEAEQLLAGADWPGNLRQLDNIVRRSLALARMQQESPGSDVRILARHVEEALGYDTRDVHVPLIPLLTTAASEYVRMATCKDSDMSLDLADAFRGFVLGAAITELGEKDGALRLLGKEIVVHNRNQHKFLRKELDRVRALCAAAGAHFPFERLLDEGEDDEAR